MANMSTAVGRMLNWAAAHPAVTGAAIGGVVGGVTTGSAEGALGGAVLGAGIGGTIGGVSHYRENSRINRHKMELNDSLKEFDEKYQKLVQEGKVTPERAEQLRAQRVGSYDASMQDNDLGFVSRARKERREYKEALGRADKEIEAVRATKRNGGLKEAVTPKNKAPKKKTPPKPTGRLETIQEKVLSSDYSITSNNMLSGGVFDKSFEDTVLSGDQSIQGRFRLTYDPKTGKKGMIGVEGAAKGKAYSFNDDSTFLQKAQRLDSKKKGGGYKHINSMDDIFITRTFEREIYDMADEASEVAGDISQTEVLERSGIIDWMKENPVATAGIAVGGGFLLSNMLDDD